MSGQVRVLGVRVDCLDMQAALERLAGMVEAGGPCRLVATVNAEFVMHAHRDPEFAAVLESADLAVVDGSGVLWAARRQGCDLAGKVAGIDLVTALAELCAAQGWRPFLLGARPGVAEAAAARWAVRFPGFQAAGAWAGEPGPAGDADALRRINAARPHLLLVAYGHPWQERWIARNRKGLPVPLAIGVGGAFDFAAGRVRRAPAWMRRVHLEWLFRLVIQPWRARRMAVLPEFALRVLRDR